MQPKYKKGDLKACYWPGYEPQVVIITNVHEDEDFETGETTLSYSVRKANSSVYAGAKPEYLKEFNYDEFRKALLEYQIKEHERLAGNYRYDLKKLEEKNGTKI